MHTLGYAGEQLPGNGPGTTGEIAVGARVGAGTGVGVGDHIPRFAERAFACVSSNESWHAVSGGYALDCANP